jgi:hypothetical protein
MITNKTARRGERQAIMWSEEEYSRNEKQPFSSILPQKTAPVKYVMHSMFFALIHLLCAIMGACAALPLAVLILEVVR